MLLARPIEDIVLIDSLLNASGSSNELSPGLATPGERYVLFVPPFKARSKFDGMLCDSSGSSSSNLCLAVGV